jgi:hypothetical protein
VLSPSFTFINGLIFDETLAYQRFRVIKKY